MNRKNIPTAVKWTALALLGLVVAIILVAALIDWSAWREPIAQFASKRLQREVQIGGLEVRLLSRRPRIEVTDLTVANPRWAGSGKMADIDSIAVELSGPSLLVGNLLVLKADVVNPRLSLLRAASGRANWQLKPRQKQVEPQEPMDLPVIRSFTLQGGKLELTDKQHKLRFDGRIQAAERISGANRYPFRLEGKGELNDRPFKLEITGGPLINVERSDPYRFDVDMRAGATRVAARGTIRKPFDFAQLKVDLRASGEDLADLYYFSGLALPNTPPYQVQGRVARKETLFEIQDFSGKVGDSKVSGNLAIETGTQRPFLRGELVSRSLDLDDMAPALGAAPASEGSENISPAQRKLAKTMSQRRRLFPDAGLQVERVRAMDADIKFRADSVQARRIPIREVTAHVKLENGLLTVAPLSFVLPQGRFSGQLQLDARQDVPRTSLDFRIRGVQLGQFKPRNGEAPIEGILSGRIKLTGHGDSVQKVLSTADGLVTAIVPHGEVREAFAELTGVNVARGLGLLLAKDQQQVTVRCGVADFQLKDGKLKAKNLVFDTENVLITGEGDISLDAEQFDLTIKGQPKKLRFFRVRAPISIEGPLRKPNIGIEGEETAKQGGVAALLATLAAPLAAVVAFVDPGLAEDANCSKLLQQAERKDTPEPRKAT